MARSDFTRGKTTGSGSFPSVGSASFLPSLRARRRFHSAERNLIRMSVLDQPDGGAIRAAICSIASEGQARALWRSPDAQGQRTPAT